MTDVMNIVIAPDSFKESLTALEAANAIEEGFKTVINNANYVKVPMADGGEGTVQSIVDATGGTIINKKVKGPLFDAVDGFYGLSGDGKIAVIEMAAASGLDKVETSQRNPLKTTTWGFGELIADALDKGVEEILLGIGGSATNDGGAGMIQSLGGKLLNNNGEMIEPNGKGLGNLDSIDLSSIHPRISEVKFKVACDVDNPLTGKNGASHIYGPQKGGTEEQIFLLDSYLAHYAKVIKESLGKDVEYIPGAGAAGGLGAGLIAFLDAKLQSGGDLLVELLQIDEKIKKADLVITGEGGLDHQTIFGKTPIAIAKVAQYNNVPVIAIAGCIKEGHQAVHHHGINAVFSILPELTPLNDALENGYENIKLTSRNIASIIDIFINK